MVLGAIVLVAAGSCMSLQSPLSPAEGVQRAQAFLKLAQEGVVPGNVGSLPDISGPSLIPESSKWMFSIGEGNRGLQMDFRSGKITLFRDEFDELHEAYQETSALPLAKLVPFCERLYAQAGYVGGLSLYSQDLDGTNGPPASIMLHFLPKHQGVSFLYESAVLIRLEHRTGRVEVFDVWERPRPPALVSPQVSGDVARLKGYQKMLETRPRFQQLWERHPMRLGIWKPQLDAVGQHPYDFFDLNTAQLERVRGGEGLLVYWTYLHDPTSYVGDFVGRVADVWVDAASGRVLALDADEVGIGGGTITNKKSTPFGWNIKGSEIKVYSKFGVASCRNATVSLQKPPGGFEGHANYLLRMDKLTIRCQYDRKLKLLRTFRDGLPSYGRPSATLTSAIEAL